MMREALPFHGVKVVDFGQYIAGPAVAMILGDLGATVIHIDPPNGPLWDSPANATLNRNKLLVELDLKSDEGRSEALDLIAEADILIENFRPGVMRRLGIDFAALRRARPELITVSIPGFASNDELRREWRAFESVIAASSGVFTDMGLNRVLMGVNPSFSPLPLASAYGTMLAVSAAALALQARVRTGRGDHIEVPLASAVMEGLCYNSIKIDDYPLRYQTQREQEIERRRDEGLPMDVAYDDLQAFLDPFYRSYPCKDGRSFYVVCPSHKFHAKRCLQTLGIYDELIGEGLQEVPDTYLPASEWSSDVWLRVYPLPKFWADRIFRANEECVPDQDGSGMGTHLWRGTVSRRATTSLASGMDKRRPCRNGWPDDRGRRSRLWRDDAARSDGLARGKRRSHAETDAAAEDDFEEALSTLRDKLLVSKDRRRAGQQVRLAGRDQSSRPLQRDRGAAFGLVSSRVSEPRLSRSIRRRRSSTAGIPSSSA